MDQSHEKRDITLLTNFNKQERVLYEAALIYASNHAKGLAIEENAYDRLGGLLPGDNSLHTARHLTHIDRGKFWDKFRKLKKKSTVEHLQIIKGSK